MNYPFEFLARCAWLHALIGAWGEFPLTWLHGSAPTPWYRRFPDALGRSIEYIERGAAQVVLRAAGTFTGATNHRAEVMLRGRRNVLSGMKAGVLRQLCKCVRRRAFVSALGAPDVVYSDHYERIELPNLVVQGEHDRIANAHFTRTDFFDRIRAADKTWLFDPDIAHGEIEAAPVACERLYPRIVAWLNERNTR